MDFTSLLQSCRGKTCVISVDIYPDDKYGNIRVMAANKAHAEEVERIWGHGFEPDLPYETSFPKNHDLEDACYRCAVLHQELHAYSDLKELGLWVELFFLPLESDREDKGYCLFSYRLASKPDAVAMADVAPDVASAVLASFLKLHGEKDLKTCITEVLNDIREISDARRCCILLMDLEAGECSVLGDSTRKDSATPTGESTNKSFYKVAVTWDRMIGNNKSLIIKNEQDMQIVKEVNPDWYESLKRASVETLILFPLKYNGKLVGYIWSSNFDLENLHKIKAVLELSTFFIAAKITNYQLVKKLELLSSIDLLTGVKNRNAMNNWILEFTSEKYRKPETLGIVFADLNGLKRVNDRKGHVAGDLLIKTAAELISQVFSGADVYRAGGDEFMIIVENCTDEFLLEKVEELRRLCDSHPDVSFSIGRCFDDSNLDILKDMSLADARMYEDKEQYYRNNPDKKYR